MRHAWRRDRQQVASDWRGPARGFFLPPRLHFSFTYAKHAFSYLVGARKYCTFGARNAARNRADVMEIVRGGGRTANKLTRASAIMQLAWLVLLNRGAQGRIR
jgi:hypothetical protein